MTTPFSAKEREEEREREGETRAANFGFGYRKNGSDAAAQEESQVNRQRSAVLRPELKGWPRVWRERDPVQDHYGMTMSDVYAILFVGANGCSPVSGF